MELLNEVANSVTMTPQSIAVRHEALTSAILLLSQSHRISVTACGTRWAIRKRLQMPPWPTLDESALVRSSIEMVIQVNGKVRGKIQVAADASKG